MDEVHMVKRSTCVAAKCLNKIPFNSKLASSATPLLNKVNDYHGYLVQLAGRPRYFETINLPKKSDNEILFGLYDKENNDWEDWFGNTPQEVDSRAKLQEANEKGFPLQMLCPQAFRLMGGRTGWSAEACRMVLRPILKMTQMRRLTSRPVETLPGVFVKPGGNIPPYSITTVELTMTKETQRKYDKVTQTWQSRIGMEDEVEDDPDHEDTMITKGLAATLNNQAHRGLQHTSFDVSLASLTVRMNPGVPAGTAAEVATWKNRDLDHGVTFRYEKSRMGPEMNYPAYKERLPLASVLLQDSPKMAFICSQLFIWKTEGRRAVIFFNWPMCQW